MPTYYFVYKTKGKVTSTYPHKVVARSVEEAKGKALKGTRYQYNEVVMVSKPK
jgi:hypothetical protein